MKLFVVDASGSVADFREYWKFVATTFESLPNPYEWIYLSWGNHVRQHSVADMRTLLLCPQPHLPTLGRSRLECLFQWLVEGVLIEEMMFLTDGEINHTEVLAMEAEWLRRKIVFERIRCFYVHRTLQHTSWRLINAFHRCSDLRVERRATSTQKVEVITSPTEETVQFVTSLQSMSLERFRNQYQALEWALIALTLRDNRAPEPVMKAVMGFGNQLYRLILADQQQTVIPLRPVLSEAQKYITEFELGTSYHPDWLKYLRLRDIATRGPQSFDIVSDAKLLEKAHSTEFKLVFDCYPALDQPTKHTQFASRNYLPKEDDPDVWWIVSGSSTPQARNLHPLSNGYKTLWTSRLTQTRPEVALGWISPLMEPAELDQHLLTFFQGNVASTTLYFLLVYWTLGEGVAAWDRAFQLRMNTDHVPLSMLWGNGFPTQSVLLKDAIWFVLHSDELVFKQAPSTPLQNHQQWLAQLYRACRKYSHPIKDGVDVALDIRYLLQTLREDKLQMTFGRKAELYESLRSPWAAEKDQDGSEVVWKVEDDAPYQLHPYFTALNDRRLCKLKLLARAHWLYLWDSVDKPASMVVANLDMRARAMVKLPSAKAYWARREKSLVEEGYQSWGKVEVCPYTCRPFSTVEGKPWTRCVGVQTKPVLSLYQWYGHAVKHYQTYPTMVQFWQYVRKHCLNYNQPIPADYRARWHDLQLDFHPIVTTLTSELFCKRFRASRPLAKREALEERWRQQQPITPPELAIPPFTIQTFMFFSSEEVEGFVQRCPITIYCTPIEVEDVG